jgi:peptidyl-prolyl cis-trans isomerase D
MKVLIEIIHNLLIDVFTLFLRPKLILREMQIIQNIREKGAAIIIVVIAISLIGFILMDAKQGSGNGIFGGSVDNVGKVNGEKVTVEEFNRRVKQAEDAETGRTGQQPSGAAIDRIRDQVWNQIVAERVFYKEAEKLGINLTSSEVKAILLSNDPSNPFTQERDLVDPATGKLDMTKAQDAYNNIKKSKGEQRAAVDARILEPLKLSTAVAKYGGMISAAAYYPTWMKEKDAAEAKSFATISYVAIPYNEISDSAVTVTDADINGYVAKRKDLFKQESGRTISYVAFSQLPTAEDSTKAKKLVDDIKTSFAADTNAKSFTAKSTSTIDFVDEYLPKAKINSRFTDTIVKQPAGTVYGPYVDGKNYVLAKVIGSKMMPDSVKARHILIGTNDPQTGKPLMEDAAAKKLADSILNLVKAGGDFAALAKQYSTDGSKDKGGDLGTFGYGQMVPEFNTYTFSNPVGSKAVVKTQFGYHVIDILSQTAMKPAYKIAFVGKEITASDLTVNNASLAATKASAQKDAKALEGYLKTIGKNMIVNPQPVKENDFAVGNMENARGLVKWAFNAKKGEVSEPFPIGDDFVVATVHDVFEEGTQSASIARRGAEAIIRNEKKAAMIIEKIGTNATMQTAAAKYNKQILTAGADSSITLAAQMINGLGVEYKLIGAAFNKANLNKESAPFAGTSAVYIIKTDAIQNKPDLSPEVTAQQQTAAMMKIRQSANNWFEALRKQADIKDKRSTIF